MYAPIRLCPRARHALGGEDTDGFLRTSASLLLQSRYTTRKLLDR